VPLDLLDPMNYLDTITDFLYEGRHNFLSPPAFLSPQSRDPI
jgi:hypothetical protein